MRSDATLQMQSVKMKVLLLLILVALRIGNRSVRYVG